MTSKRSAALLLFRRTGDRLEVFLAHPGGPFWAHRDHGAWTLPKGEVNDGEEPLAAAVREFREETGIDAVAPFLPLGEVRQKGGKRVVAWAWKGDADATRITSNTASMEHPRGSGRVIEFPEIDRCAWFDVEAARRRLNPAQAEFIDRLTALLA
jgi:predicted NUDIX family NTP pyrophosphohydrolase